MALWLLSFPKIQLVCTHCVARCDVSLCKYLPVYKCASMCQYVLVCASVCKCASVCQCASELVYKCACMCKCASVPVPVFVLHPSLNRERGCFLWRGLQL